MSKLTSPYVNEGRLEEDRPQELTQLSHDYRGYLTELQKMWPESETMNTQHLRQEGLHKFTNAEKEDTKDAQSIASQGSLCQVESSHMQISRLTFAVINRDMGMIKLLLKHGADADMPSLGGDTPLHLAVPCEDIDIINFLLDHDAQVVRARSEGSTPLHDAVNPVNTLINRDTDVNQACPGQMTPLRATKTRESILTHQKKAGEPKADPDTLAQMASKTGKREALELLVDMGVNVKLRTSIGRHGGESLVWLAAAHGYDDMLKPLLAKEADISIPSTPTCCEEACPKSCLLTDGKTTTCTAVQIAVSHNHWHCAQLLDDHAGDLNAPGR
ncbi:MAG: hypothetical protein Q9168_007350 [Polycauliona sp. 1 TL-2023]